MAGERDSVELRTDLPREIADVVDAISVAQRLTRGQLVVRILSDWAQQRMHEHSVLSRVVRSNPQDADKHR